ncbi:MAG: hypothetical protein JWO95_3482, partial [Verrucomicrobiales bacterium]|nr:hypothetical protein [Verrucomicrobiales bacterium]
VLKDTNRVLFCNNEDGAKTKTRIWFVPPPSKRYGCAFVGYDDGWEQGGMNSEGLACDWLAGWRESWTTDPQLPKVKSNCQVLEACATVDEAIAFYREHAEPGFWYSKVLLTDKSGASVLIGAHDGKLQVERTAESRGLGYGGETLERWMAHSSEPTVTNGVKILRACLQKGKYATKYFNVFDVKSGDLMLYPFPKKDTEVKLNLAVELAKGPHYYDMPKLQKQMKQAPRPLLANMKKH